MPLSIRNPKAEKLARQVAALSGENVTQAIIHALEKRLQALQAKAPAESLVEEIMDISRRCSSLEDRDHRNPDDILDYDDQGVPSSWSSTLQP